MQHLDDALIAEWVDGAIAEDSSRYDAIAAHVDQCDECRLRVEEERALAGHVRQLLGVAAPPDRTPPFEEVLHRAGTTPKRAKPPLLRMRHLAWAATVAIAGGLGWYARGIVIGSPMERTAPAVAADRVGATGTTGTTGAAGTTGVAAERDAAVADLAAVRPGAPPAGRGRVAEEAQERLAAAGRAESAAADEGRRELVSAERPALEDRVARRDAAAAPPAAAEPRPMAQLAAPAENELRLQKSVLEPWTAANRAAAEAVLGTPPLMIDGLPVTSIELSADGRAVRVRQDLGGGTLLELVQSRRTANPAPGLVSGAVAEAAAPAFRARGASVATDAVVVNGIRVLGGAAIPVDSLRKLLASLQR